jgi:glycosyltransferase involved in cell wall biosynthesis
MSASLGLGENQIATDSPVDSIRVSLVIPCLNEADNIVQCVHSARAVLEENGIAGEVIVVDNGSTDGSGDLARAAGASVVTEPRRGYGNAYLTGFAAANGEYIVIADADLSYDFSEVPRFVAELERGGDLVIGERLRIHPGAMPVLNRYVGNPVTTALVNRIFHTRVHDAWCGMRGLRRSILPMLDLQTSGMELAIEMIIRASQEGLDVREIPIELHPRGGRSKLEPLRDGWRAVHLILGYSPNHLFMVPGAVMTLVGSFMVCTVLADVSVFGRHWYLHTLIAGSVLVIVGIQTLGLGLCAQAYATYFLHKRGTLYERLRRRGFGLQHGLMLGAGLVVAGVVLAIVIFTRWAEHSFGSLSQERLTLLSATLTIAGSQLIFVSLLLSMIELARRRIADG